MRVHIGVMGLVMQKCAMDLKDWSHQTSTNPSVDRDEKMLHISEDITKGLAFINNLNIIHNDLKPRNVFVDRYNKPFIGDFGVATNRGEPLPGYMNQYFDKESLADETSDSWLLGATLWEFWSDEAFNVVEQIHLNHIRNATIKDILTKLLRPRERRPSASEVLNLFEPRNDSFQRSPIRKTEDYAAEKFWDALTTGNTTALNPILSKKLIPADTEKDGLTGLQFACHNNLVDAVKTLLEFGADPQLKDADGKLPIQLSTSVDVWRALAAKMPTPPGDLFDAAETGDDVSARLILALEKNPSTKLSEKKEKPPTPLHLATIHGHAPVCEVFLQAGAYVDGREEAEMTPLIWAALKGHLNGAKVLVERGANIHARDCLGQTPLFHAAFHGRVDVVCFLLDKGASVDCRNKGKRTPLMEAVQWAHLNVAEDSWGERRLHNSAEYGDVDIVRLLLDNGAEINGLDKGKRTPLLRAAYRGCLNVVQLLVERNADVNARDKNGLTARERALVRNERDIVKFLASRMSATTLSAPDLPAPDVKPP
ncbi:hypothetical protein HDU96_009520 [Phlyctochytrium bullatum]|nr:hypothetical protein HDU96_009520 [Phlyctochytrium bullatum]